MLFSVKLRNVAKDRDDHNTEVYRSQLFFSQQKNRSTHTTTQKLVKPVSKLMTNIMLGEKVK